MSFIAAFARIFGQLSSRQHVAMPMTDYSTLKQALAHAESRVHHFMKMASDHEEEAKELRDKVARRAEDGAAWERSATDYARQLHEARHTIARMEKEAAAAHDREQAVIRADRCLTELGANGPALLALSRKTRVSKADKEMLSLSGVALGQVRSVASSAPQSVRDAISSADKLRDLNANGEEKRTLEKANDAQAARAMARNTKNDFVVFQKCVHVLTDELDKLCSKNQITKEDLGRMRAIRAELRNVAGRKV